MQNFRFSLKVIIPFIVSILFVSIFTLLSIYTFQTKHINQISLEKFENISTILTQTIQKDTELSKGLAQLIAKDQNTINLFESQEREKLFFYLHQTYMNFNQQYNITHFYLHNLDKTNFLRLHNKNIHSDLINRVTLDKAVESGTVSSGIEFSMNHNYTLRVVSPWFDKEHLIGYIEIGKEIDSVINEISKTLKSNIILTINKDAVTNNLIQNDPLDKKKYTDLKDYYIINSTLSNIKPQNDILKILNSQNDISNIKVTNQQVTYNINSKPFYNITGQEVGKIYVLIDVTNEIADLEWVILKTFILLLFTILLIIYFYFKYIKKIDNQMKNYVDIVEFNYKFEQFVNHISHHLIYCDKTNDAINKTLKELGTILEANRAYLFMFKENYSIMDNTHEWCSLGTEPAIDSLHNESTEFFSWWIAQCKAKLPIAIEDINDMPLEAQNEKDALLAQNIKSLLVYPIVFNGEVSGFIGIDMVTNYQKWSQTHHSFVKITAESISSALDKKRYEEELQISAKVFESSSEGIIITDKDTNIIKVNGSFSKITGYLETELIGKKPTILQSHWHEKEFYDEMWKALEEKSLWEGEVKDRRKNGELYISLSTLIAIKDDEKNIINYIGINRDVTDLKKIEDRIKTLAYYDSLTNLPNRTLFLDRLEQSTKYCTRNKGKVALLFIDLDNFKTVNDTYGHHAGDVVLQKVAEILTNSVRNSDTVSRLGGDEFTIILRRIYTKDNVTQIANKIISQLLEPIIVNDIPLHIGSSIGAAIYPDDANDKETLIKLADSAMYEAKTNGKNCLRFAQKDERIN